MSKHAVLGLLIAVTVPALAASQQVPAHTTPSRDVQVIYRLDDHGKALRQRSVWQAATARQRVDVYGGDGTWLIEDGKNLTATIVDDADRKVVDAKIRPGPLNGGKAGFQRLGTMTVAGFVCTEWAVTPDDKATPTQQVCLTSDGVPLNMRAGATLIARATSLTYRRADPSLFKVPAAYQRTER